MSYYNSYNFISPEVIYSVVKEELKSYMDTASVDDLLFPTYINKALNKLGKSSYNIVETPLFIEDFKARLPDNFYSVREAWMCTEIPMNSYQGASSFYSQSASITTIQIAPITTDIPTCPNPSCTSQDCTGMCMPTLVQAVYKTNQEVARSYKQSYLLRPGNISARNNCDVSYSENLSKYGQNPYSSTINSFDIRDNKFVTNFRNGVVHLIFYATDYDEEGNQMIPDNYRIREYLEAFLKYKIFEILSNQTNDETFNQLQQKLVYYKQLSDEAYIMAQIEIQKESAWTKQKRIQKQHNRFNMYELPTGNIRYGRRRNN